MNEKTRIETFGDLLHFMNVANYSFKRMSGLLVDMTASAGALPARDEAQYHLERLRSAFIRVKDYCANALDEKEESEEET